jgi:carbon-monoxide dehydrogenase small subunit
MIIKFILNGTEVSINSPPNKIVLDILREEFQIHSIRRNCDNKMCGSCLILLSNSPVYSCKLPVFEIKGKEIWTMEGISSQKDFQDILNGFASTSIKLCSKCAPARALSIEGMLRQTHTADAETISETVKMVNCECGPARRIEEAILKIFKAREKRLHGK